MYTIQPFDALYVNEGIIYIIIYIYITLLYIILNITFVISVETTLSQQLYIQFYLLYITYTYILYIYLLLIIQLCIYLTCFTNLNGNIQLLYLVIKT